MDASNKLSSVEAELDHDGDFVVRQVAAPGSTGPLGGALAPLLRDFVTGRRPYGQLAKHKLAPRRNSGKLLLVMDRWRVLLLLLLLGLHRVDPFKIVSRPLRWQCVCAQRWRRDEKCADFGGLGLGPVMDLWPLHALGEHVWGRRGDWDRWGAQLVRHGLEHLVECTH